VIDFKKMLGSIPNIQYYGQTNVNVQYLTADSRQVKAGTAFVAVRGTQSDGHKFIQQAIDKGANAIICETLPEQQEDNIAYAVVKNSAYVLGKSASIFYGEPSTKLKLVGITGTNGKTTTATLLYDLFTGLGYKCGLLSTVENRIANKVVPSTHTTPDPVSLNALLDAMVAAGVEYAFMEVSSHAIHQERIAGLDFKVAVFTNITHDHLDYHKTFDEYIKAKKHFFDKLPKNAIALTNADDKNGSIMVQNTKAKIYRYSLRKMTHFKVKILENALTGLHLNLDGSDYHGRLIGEFNAYNTLACYATAVLLGEPKDKTMTVLSGLGAAEGRFDYTYNAEIGIMGIVDYAHTPDALEKVLQTIHKLRKKGQRVITVAGCGGDRDPKKRPTMGKIGAMMSDLFIITSDNPRSEDPEKIIDQIEMGVPADAKHKILRIVQRRDAIQTACAQARKGDVILLAGKGHEKYQEISGIKHPFDDKQLLTEALARC
jgi:UDP-N-acetylmuramoyl-L-alanyl-D-glutamate--2,6-diaminopimelate ligase